MVVICGKCGVVFSENSGDMIDLRKAEGGGGVGGGGGSGGGGGGGSGGR